jgi:hypothetical protein
MMGTLSKKRNSIALCLCIIFVMQLALPITTMALTGGPSQPELQSFQPAGTSDMVDLFTGDFSYNIPLFELPGPNGGYPFNLSYQSGISMDQEASWVGLGFSLQPGSVTRQMRGLPDEFKGDLVKTKASMAPSVTVGLGAGVGIEVFGGAANLGVGFGINHNNYKGMGYSIDASIGFGKAVGSAATAGIGLSVSLDSKEGIGISPSLSLGFAEARANYNSRQGLSSVSFTSTMSVKGVAGKDYKSGKAKGQWGSSSVTSTLSLANPGYTPQISMPMRNVSMSATLKAGGAWWGIFGAPYLSGFYNEQWLKNDKKTVPNKAFGYLNYQYAENDDVMLDINREKDGMVMKESPNMAAPSLTYDIYSVTGQGISAMYRPMRNDYGIMHDQSGKSVSVSGSFGADVGPAASHVGANRDHSHSESVSGAWTEQNGLVSLAAFQRKTLNSAYEPWYFKVHGEPAVEKAEVVNTIGNDKAVRVRLTGSNNDAAASATFENSAWSNAVPANASLNRERKPRNQAIQPITNEELVQGSEEIMPVFRIFYENSSGQMTRFDRSSLKGHHTAGFIALTPNGLRYTYGLPAYNLLQEETMFSVLGQSGPVPRVNTGNNGGDDPKYDHNYTEKFLKKTELPPYAHSHLLTSILGPDYVDVTNDGVTPDDLGYWVKFTYRKVTDNNDRYRWRDPFSKAHWQEGWKTDPRDDKGSFTYGEKELWYLTRAETKSHLAVFSLEDREDGRGVAAKLQDANTTGKRVKSLQKIQLFSRAASGAVPIKTVRFEYDYSLCPGIDNGTNGSGKLTLKKLWFEYGTNSRGRFNPYQFTYHSSNPNYDILAYDRWGNYKPYPAGEYRYNYDFPYTEQDTQKKQQLDQQVASWSLKEIVTPSGGKIIVDYETDDYAYVQHKAAMQMTALVDPYSAGTGTLLQKYSLNSDNTKIRFRLEKPLPGDMPSTAQKAEVMKYLDEATGQLYFKILVNLRTPAENFHEYVAGYADIDFAAPMGLEKDASEEYVFGFFHLKKESGHHPMTLRAWQHLRTNQPELTSSGRTLKQTNNNNERARQIRSLAGFGAQIRQVFSGFYNYCNSKQWGREVIAAKSWIRLNCADLVKHGGGLRVRQITLQDNWQQDEEGKYGQVYEYTLQEQGKTISSGVATYEPLVGGDENALRYAKKFVQSVRMRSDNNLFFEYPVNESYYPGPQVGYRKVSVTSLASAALAGKDVKNITLSDGGKLFPSGNGISYGTTGATEYEFYTAKDFPVITDETDKINKPHKSFVLIPFLGSVSSSRLMASQGYSIVTNDMHGKQKRVSNYRQLPNGTIDSKPVSWVQYNYMTRSLVQNKKQALQVSNVMKDNGDGTVSVASADDIAAPDIAKYSLGQETELFTDMRQFTDRTWGGGIRFNTDVLYIPVVFAVIPVPVAVPWPNVSKSTVKLNTSVTNKVIFKAGILQSVEAYDGGSTVTTTNLKWDKTTGQVVLTSVNNNFDDPVFSYTIPAYTQYQGMGAAGQNTGLTFTIANVKKASHQTDRYAFTTSLAEGLLEPGDELILYPAEGETLANPLARVVYAGEEDGEKIVLTPLALTATAYTAFIARSGYRNQLSVSAGTITALEDPSVRGTVKSYKKKVKLPIEE